ncbi:MAG TPA: polyprenyl diphosphate synthase [Candidatus Paceibacterota bacterium]|nr:polyprenyl diphosphate synthase [Candidatus Paceibacterota bacterium]
MEQILPKHIGIMIDGNRRWAKEKKLPVFLGHKKGIERVVEIIDYAAIKGIKVLTLYGFSTENWNRPKKEVDYLMNLFTEFARKYARDFKKKGIQFCHIGGLKELPKSLQKEIKEAQKLTKNNKKMILNIALNYGGRDEIVRAIKKIIQKKISSKSINEKVVMDYLDTKGLPDVDFIIRTSGEMRLSNFLPFQGTYAELYFPKICWPDFTKKQFDLAIKEFQRRRRRFGK